MKFINKIKNKLFPDDKEILFYESGNKDQKENKFINKPVHDDKAPINYQPRSFSNTEEISDALIAGNIVVVDVSLLNKRDAYRTIDFISGVCYARNGDIKRINKTTFEFNINKQ